MSDINPKGLTRKQIQRALKQAEKVRDRDSIAKLSAMLREAGGPRSPGKETRGERYVRLMDEATEAGDDDSVNKIQALYQKAIDEGRADEPWDAPEKAAASAPEEKSPLVPEPTVEIEVTEGAVVEAQPVVESEAEPEPEDESPGMYLAAILDQSDADMLANAKEIVTLEALEEFFKGADSPDVALQSVEGIGRVTSARILQAIAAFQVERDAIVEKDDASEIAREEADGEAGVALEPSDRNIETGKEV